MYMLKKQNRHLKVLLSIGGWTYSPSFHPVVVNPTLRARFVQSSVKILEDYGFDGLDVDYEYPGNDEQARGYVELLKEMRTELDKCAEKNGDGCKFLLSVSRCSLEIVVRCELMCDQIAAPCGPDNYKKLHVKAMDRYLNFWNLMAYDFGKSLVCYQYSMNDVI